MLSDTLTEGSLVGDYRIESLLRHSSTAHVYAARHVKSNNRVALKVLARNLVSRPTIAQRFLHEGRAAARVKHSGVIEIFDVGTAGKYPYIAMQLLRGESLIERFGRGPVPSEELVGIMLPVLAAVATAHEQGVIHRDLSPQDIFLHQTESGEIQPVVLNFGMSKLIGEPSLPPPEMRSSGNISMELPYYLAPEQVHGGRDVRGATDQYSLAVVLYEGATGRRPFDGTSLMDLVDKIITGRYEPASKVWPAVPSQLSRVIARAMSMSVNERYTSLWAMGTALLPLASARDRDRWTESFARKP
jgi:serine/threonine-protein kinase